MSEKKDDNNNNNNNASNMNLAASISAIGSNSPKRNNKDEEDSSIGSPSKSESNKSFSDEKEEKDDIKNEKENKINYENLWDLNYGIDDLICQSLMSVQNKDLRKKLANSIMLVGGTSKLKGFIDFLEDRLINKLSELDNEIERVEIFNYPTIDMKTLSWIGGSILPKLESAKDMWIQKERWLGEPEKLDEQIENNLENGKKENNIEEKKEENNGGADMGSEGERSKIEEKNENTNDENNNKEKDKDGKEKNKDKKEGDKKKDEGKKKKNERHLDGGIVLLREKCPFPW
jgi:hypothetical protein